MIHLIAKIPKKVYVAVSGGQDSMAALDFLSRKHDVTVLHFNHSTKHAQEAEDTVVKFCLSRNIDFKIGRLNERIGRGRSKEDFWREKRYNFFESVTSDDDVIVTCHHLDDVVETWLFTSLHGNSRIIPCRRERYLRPFLTTKKEVFVSWCERHDVPYAKDPSNNNTEFRRNYIRHCLMPHALKINPGLSKVLKRKVEQSIW